MEFLDKIKSLIEPPKYDMFTSSMSKTQNNPDLLDEYYKTISNDPNQAQPDPNQPQQPTGQAYPMQQNVAYPAQKYPEAGQGQPAMYDPNQPYPGQGYRPDQGNQPYQEHGTPQHRQRGPRTLPYQSGDLGQQGHFQGEAPPGQGAFQGTNQPGQAGQGQYQLSQSGQFQGQNQLSRDQYPSENQLGRSGQYQGQNILDQGQGQFEQSGRHGSQTSSGQGQSQFQQSGQFQNQNVSGQGQNQLQQSGQYQGQQLEQSGRFQGQNQQGQGHIRGQNQFGDSGQYQQGPDQQDGFYDPSYQPISAHQSLEARAYPSDNNRLQPPTKRGHGDHRNRVPGPGDDSRNSSPKLHRPHYLDGRQPNMDPRGRASGQTSEQIGLRPVRDKEVAGPSRDRPKLQAVHTFSTETSGIGTSIVSSFDRSFDLEHTQEPDMNDPHKHMAINYDPDGTRYAAYAESGPHSNTDRGFDRMPQQSGSHSQKADDPTKLNVGNGKGEPMEYQEWDRRRRDSKTSPKPSPNSSRRGSFRDKKKDKHFLAAPGSAWVNWSKDRRNSFRKRLELIELKEKEAEKTRVSTPVKKARQECVRFVSREMEDQYIAEANEPIRKKPVKKAKKEKKKKRGQKTEDPLKKIKLTDGQWNTMMDYWENPMFVKLRYSGIAISLVALAFCVFTLAVTAWSTFEEPWNGSVTMGLWRVCGQLNDTETGELIPNQCWRETRFDYYSGLWDACFTANITAEAPFPASCRHLPTYGWQNGIIGLLLFSAGVGFLATILSICGLVVNNLPKKLYYYHSAGEIYFVCALICTTGLIAYPVCIETSKLIDHKYGYAYPIAWGASVGYFAAALCMMLDDLIQTSARGCCKPKGQSHLQHV